MMSNRAPCGNEGGLIGQAVIKQDRKLLRLERVEERVMLWFGPPAKRSPREATDAQPIAMSVEAKDSESSAAPISEDKERAVVWIGSQFLAT